MAYRRTENVVRRLNARHDAIVEAARDAAAAGGMAAVQIVPVAERAPSIATSPARSISSARWSKPWPNARSKLSAKLPTVRPVRCRRWSQP
jgi:hypothetical protein